MATAIEPHFAFARSRRWSSSACAVMIFATAAGNAACSGTQTSVKAPEQAAEAKLTPSAPDFSLPALDGSLVRLSDSIGKKVILIDFWSTSCEPCLVSMPLLAELYSKYRDQGLEILAISLDGPESRAQVANVVHQKGMNFPVLLDEETEVVAQYNPKRELPFQALIDRSGHIVRTKGGYSPGDETSLEAAIQAALK